MRTDRGKVQELEIPPSVFSEDDPDEIARVWIAGGDSHVSFRMGVFGDEELDSWGMILADIARQVVTAYRNTHEISESNAYATIARGYTGRIRHTVKVEVSLVQPTN